ncbi:MAG: glycosyltransferase [Lysobacter sp.]
MITKSLKEEFALRYDVIVLPIIEWDHRFQRPQHISSAFAADGHRVFYTRLTFAGWDAALHCEPVKDNLWRVSLPGPSDHNRFLQILREDAVDRCVEALVGLAREWDIQDAIILVQQPFWAKVALRLRERQGWKIVYDCMDEHDGLTALNDEILRDERGLGAAADLVVTTSLKLARKHETAARRHLLLPNAAEFEHFADPGQSSDPLPDVTGPIIGYYGAIMEWFDVDMVYQAASLRPDWTFVLIGAIDIEDVEPLKSLANVRFLGEKPYAELPPYLHRFDVAIIPFRIIPIIEATNPVKFYEYLSAGKPVVASPIPELEPFPHLYELAEDGAGLVAQSERAMAENSAEKARERSEWARQQTWAARYQRLKQSVDGLWGKASIIIVSYQSLDKMRDCVESIDRYTDYPDYEVIVVDNGSDSEVVQYLREFTSSHPRFRLIDSKVNLGFSGANNLGMRAVSADSEYVVLLNNDTVVTATWLGGMVRWLQDTTVGLVGPTTWPNGTANEAAIAVPYDDMAGMHEFAAEFIAANRGEAFDIPMLAFYCVGMHRTVMEQVGPLDEAYGIGMFEDDDYAIRVRNAGFRVICARDVFIHHVGRSSFGKLQEDVYNELFQHNKNQYEEKWSVAWRRPAARRDFGQLVSQAAIAPSRELPGQLDPEISRVSVILVNYNGLAHLGPCLDSLALLNYDDSRIEIIVVDNGSSDDSVGWLHDNWPQVKVIRNQLNVGFSRACNQAVECASGHYVAFLNNDMRVDPEWLNGLLEPFARDETIACVGSMVMNWEGTAVEFSGRHDDPFSLAYEPLQLDYKAQRAGDSYALFVSGGAMLLRRADFVQSGGFDQRYFMYHEDVDLCWRLWISGKRCCVAPHSIVYHRGGASSRKLESAVVQGWGQKHLLWTALKNFDDANLRSALPLLIYFLVERGRWSEVCVRSLEQVFEETQAALTSILHARSVVQGRRTTDDGEIFNRLGHPFAFILRSPLFAAMAEKLTMRHPCADLDFSDPTRVAEAMIEWLRGSIQLRSEYAAIWQADANRKFVRHGRFTDAPDALGPSPSDLAITSWGPREGLEGQAINARVSGNSSLWVTGANLDQVAALTVAGGKFPCIHMGDTLTCELPERFTKMLMRPGVHQVALLTSGGVSCPLGAITIVAANQHRATGLRARVRHLLKGI